MNFLIELLNQGRAEKERDAKLTTFPVSFTPPIMSAAVTEELRRQTGSDTRDRVLRVLTCFICKICQRVFMLRSHKPADPEGLVRPAPTQEA